MDGGIDDIIGSIKKVGECVYEIPASHRHDMKVPARIFASERALKDAARDRSLWQISNVATLPGVKGFVCAMPDIHEGYGFPIGGVAATDIENGGVISPGGIGYDINCGVRLLTSDLGVKDVRKKLDELANSLYQAVPAGVGVPGPVKLNFNSMNEILTGGARKAVELGFGCGEDLTFCEEGGCMEGADCTKISDRAKERGLQQLGTLGAGNHFLEVQAVDKIFDKEKAGAFGLRAGTAVVMVHCGSRGLGHQTCSDYVRYMMNDPKLRRDVLADRELICAPFHSDIARDYFSSMSAAANFAWANRQVITSNIRESWKKIFGVQENLRLVYDVSHNIGKIEHHDVNGQSVKLLVHRKGATRAFAPGSKEIPKSYLKAGQPVLVPGTMGTASYVLAGTSVAMDSSFGSCCHGAGRRMSRGEAKRTISGDRLRAEMEKGGIVVRCSRDSNLSEESPAAYKDVEEVVEIVDHAGIAKMVSRLLPMAVIKG